MSAPFEQISGPAHGGSDPNSLEHFIALLAGAAPANDTEFWQARPVLQHLHDFARARMAGPWGVLGVAMVRALSVIPPHIVIPPIIGGEVSLNLFLALVGPSGGGKGACTAAGRGAIRFVYGSLCDEVPWLPIGSGEGIARTFSIEAPIPRGEPDRQAAALAEAEANRVTSAIFDAGEIDTMAALFSRSGATLDATLRKTWMGEQLGFANGQKHTRTQVDEHTYRAGLVAGVQPARSGVLLDAADGGTPQRFLWLPVADPGAPDDTPAGVLPLTVDIAPLTGPVDVPAAVAAEIRSARLRALRGEPDVDPLAGHALLARLKVAAALGLLDGRGQEVDSEDWELAGHVAAVSDASRQECQEAMAESLRAAGQARTRGMIAHSEAVASHDADRDAHVQAVILAKLRDGQLTRRELQRSIPGRHGHRFKSALAELVDSGEIRETTGEGRKGVSYELT